MFETARMMSNTIGDSEIIHAHIRAMQLLAGAALAFAVHVPTRFATMIIYNMCNINSMVLQLKPYNGLELLKKSLYQN